MLHLLATVSLLVAAVALVAATLEHRAAGRFPLFDLLRTQFGVLPPWRRWRWLTAGAALALLPLGVGWALGWMRLQPVASRSSVEIGLALVTPIVQFVWAALEEVIFRGAVLQQTARRLGKPVAVLVSASLFALAHLRAAAAPAGAGFDFAVRAIDGVGYGVAALATNGLWAPVLWHFGKNVCIWLFTDQATLCLAPGLTHATDVGPAFWTGGAQHAGALECATALLVVGSVGWRLRSKSVR